MTNREERIARNEALFREVNERVKLVHDQIDLGGETIQVLCECGDDDCVEEIEISAVEYERVRTDSRQFLLAPGHVSPDVETVVAEGEGYEVARKHPAEAELADKTDPRA
jgi:hypothetical protein